MSVRLSIALVAAALAGGVGLGWLLGAGEQPGARSLRGAPNAPFEQHPLEQGSPPIAAPAGGSPTLRQALQAISLPSIEAGSATITGFVRTESGGPLPGVLVRAEQVIGGSSALSPPTDGSPPPDGDLETLVRNYVSRELGRLVRRREATTNEEGRYAIEGVREAKYSVSAYRKGLALSVSGGRQNGEVVQASGSLDFVAEELVAVPVTVLLGDGSQPERAFIQCQRRERDRSRNHDRNWTPQESTIFLQPGDYSLTATVSGSEDLRSPPHEMTLLRDETAESLTLQLRSRTGIRGKVTLPEGQEVEHLYFFALQVSAGQEPDPERLRSEGRRAQSHPASGYAFYDLEPGTWLVGTTRNRWMIEASKTVVVGEGVATLDFELPPVDPREYVAVRVLGEGRLLSDVSFRIYYRTENRGTGAAWPIRATPIRTQEGTFLIPRWGRYRADAETKAKDARWYLRVRSQRYGEKEEEYAPRSVDTITVRFEDPAVVEVTLGRYVGSGHEGAMRLALVPVHASDEDREVLRTNPSFREQDNQLGTDGKQTFSGLQPGIYEVAISARLGWRGGANVDHVRIRVRPGTNRVTVPMPALYTLAVRVADLKPGMAIVVMATGRHAGLWARRTVGGSGRVTFERLPAGAYRLRRQGGGVPTAQKEIQLPEQQAVDW